MRFVNPDGRESKEWINQNGVWRYDEKITTREHAQRLSNVDGFAKNGTSFQMRPLMALMRDM